MVERARQVMEDFSNKIISERISERSGRGEESPKDLLDILLAASERAKGDTVSFSTKDLRDQMFTFIGAGHETTATTLMWIFYDLSQHPLVLESVLKEIDDVFANKESDKDGAVNERVSYEDINKFSYLLQVIKESMRLHPPVPIMGRTTVDQCQIGEYIIPAGSHLPVCILALHSHPDFWERPDEYIPERFSAARLREKPLHPFQFLPFSAGPRNCIGQRFAQMEVIVVLALILRQYRVSMSVEDLASVRFEETITYQTKNLFCTFTKRAAKI